MALNLYKCIKVIHSTLGSRHCVSVFGVDYLTTAYNYRQEFRTL